ncbi:MAG: dicarboxylate/amino acid:cation symporter [Bacteroidota bacterium]
MRFQFRSIQLHWQILIAFILAILFGVFFPEQVDYVAWLGDLFLRALQMIIIPLIFSSIVSGITQVGSAENLGRLGLKTMGYYIFTSILAIFTGLLFVNIIKPGEGARMGLEKEVEGLGIAAESFGSTLLHVIPTNVVKAFADNEMLSVIFFAIIFGFFITRVKSKSKKIMTGIFESLFEVMMKLTMFIIYFAPLGIFGIVARVVASQEDLLGLASSMGQYMFCVLAALFVHAFISLPLLVRFLGKAKPFRHLRSMATPLITAFSTSSSSATLPLTINAVENNSGVSNKISSFTLPLGATINMDGTALYELVAAMFIAQAYGLELSIWKQLIAVAAALLASIGAAGIPMAGLVMITVVLKAMGLPFEGVGLILAVDRILDMFRTATNVWSDSCGAVIIAKSEGEVLKV